MNTATTVDDYIAEAPTETQEKLQALRAAIKATAPSAQERMSYGMPYYNYKGRLVYFRHWKNHIGVYIPTPVIEEHASELKAYTTAKGTIRFPLNKPLPLDLITKLIHVRMQKNDEATAQKKK